MSDYLPNAWAKEAHEDGCDGRLHRSHGTVYVDRIGRIGNGGIVAHVYRCNRYWDGCPARVLVPETTMHTIATRALANRALVVGHG